VTAALGMDQLDYSQMQLTHILYPLLDAKRPTATQIFTEFYDIIERQIKEGNILVHCSAGVSRVNYSS
jgi:protein-tyrosine phosphatase